MIAIGRRFRAAWKMESSCDRARAHATVPSGRWRDRKIRFPAGNRSRSGGERSRKRLDAKYGQGLNCDYTYARTRGGGDRGRGFRGADNRSARRDATRRADESIGLLARRHDKTDHRPVAVNTSVRLYFAALLSVY